MPNILTYSIGNKNSPSDPFGQEQLTINESGALEYHRHHINQTWSLTGQADFVFTRSLFNALEHADFARVNAHPLSPGEQWAIITCLLNGQEYKAVLDLSESINPEGFQDIISWGESWTAWLRNGKGPKPGEINIINKTN